VSGDRWPVPKHATFNQQPFFFLTDHINTNCFDSVQALLKPFPAELMAAHEISKRINKPKYDAPDCNSPVEA
jgi:putative SOS response-associated peptidase YedK